MAEGKIYTGNILLASTIQPTGNQPLDDRVVVYSYADLLKTSTFGTAVYEGMLVVTLDTNDLYTLLDASSFLDGSTTVPATAWKKISASESAGIITEDIKSEDDVIIASGTSVDGAFQIVINEMTKDERVVSEALVDLDSRIVTISGSTGVIDCGTF